MLVPKARALFVDELTMEGEPIEERLVHTDHPREPARDDVERALELLFSDLSVEGQIL